MAERRHEESPGRREWWSVRVADSRSWQNVYARIRPGREVWVPRRASSLVERHDHRQGDAGGRHARSVCTDREVWHAGHADGYGVDETRGGDGDARPASCWPDAQTGSRDAADDDERCLLVHRDAADHDAVPGS